MGSSNKRTGLEIAVVGMAGRFPGARSTSELWQNLINGVESITSFSAEELLAAGVDAKQVDDPAYVRARGVLSDIDCFDARLFGYSPREARLMDPQHRLFLECAWNALEDGGRSPDGAGTSVGVFASAGFPGYLLNLHTHRHEPGFFDSAETLLGNEKDHIATRVSYKLDLTGPSMAIQTACSSSLAAVHQACRSLLSGDCDGALAGGVFVAVPQVCGYTCAEGGALSRDGHCRTFDANATGFVPGSGVGVVFLKRLEDAEADKDPIRAVIRGSAANNDGAAKIGYTAPSVIRQAEAIGAAYRFAEVDPATVSYVEVHGAATELGDPIEIEALSRAFGKHTGDHGPCWLGSIKTNVGHLDAAAGVSGLIKTVLSLEQKQIPASLNFEKPNPRIPFEGTRFRVAKEQTTWPETPRRAGVSSLGLGGTNVHVILEEYAKDAGESGVRPWSVLTVSAQSKSALKNNTAQLREHLNANRDDKLEDVAYTLQVGRKPMKYRLAAAAKGSEQGPLALDEARIEPVTPALDGREVVFMFPGGGAQHVGMARDLLAEVPSFRETVEHCCEQLETKVARDVRSILSARTADSLISSPAVGLPALFVIELALARLWQRWGVQPAAMIGHSLGEYVAACVAGVLSTGDALALVTLRGRLFETLAPGAMLSVNLPEDEIRSALSGNLSVAAINGPNLCTIAGPKEAVARLQAELAERGGVTRLVPIDVASHCELVRPMLPLFERFLSSIELASPRIPYVSNLSGRWVTDADAQRPSYWTEHLCKPVRFSEGLTTILSEPQRVLLEVGPGHTLTRLARSHDIRETPVFPTLPHPTDEESPSDHGFMLRTLGRLWAAGVEIDWEAYHQGFETRRISLPGYCFDKERFWVDPIEPNPDAQPLQKNGEIDSWFYLPGFEPALRPKKPTSTELAEDDCLWLIFGDDGELTGALRDYLEAARQQVVCVRAGDTRRSDGLSIRPNERGDYRAITEILMTKRPTRVRVVHLWQVGEPAVTTTGRASFTLSQNTGYFSLTYLAQALISANVPHSHVTILCSGAQSAWGTDATLPERATILGPCLVLPQEAPNISCRIVDLARTRDSSLEQLTAIALSEAWQLGGDKVVAYRGASRLAKSYTQVRVGQGPAGGSRFKQGGNYLLIGGLGPVGRHIGRYLAEQYKARLSVVQRSAVPPLDPRRSRAIEQMEASGAKVRVYQADIAEHDAIRQIIQTIEDSWGPLDGVIHCASASQDQSVSTSIDGLGQQESATQFRAKVDGLHNLARLFEGKALDFCVVFSSNASILGGLGMTAYAAANSFVDAFCSKMRAQNGLPWLSVNWDEWLVDDEPPATAAAGGLHDFAMTPKESLEALERALALDNVGQLVVSTGSLEHRLEQWVGQAKPPVAEEETEPEIDTVQPRDALEEALAEIWREILGVAQVGIQDNFFELGGHSLLAVHLRAKVKKRLGRDLPLEAIFRSGTIEGMADALKGNASSDFEALVPLRAEGSNPKFFCVPPASGVARVYEPLCHHLGEEQPFYAFQARGLDDQHEPFANLDEMVSTYLNELTRMQPNGPYILGGWCAGGTIAYEMAQRLTREGHQVHLALMDVDQPNEQDESDDARDLFAIARTHARNIGVDLPLRRDDLNELSAQEQLQYVLDQYKLFGVVPKDTTLESMRTHWDVFLGTLGIVRNYRFEPYGGPIALFLADELDYHRLVDMEVTQDFAVSTQMRDEFNSRADAWKSYSAVPIEVFEVPGYHSMIALEPYVETLAERLLDWIESFSSKSG